jgi:hypothetical protein
LRMARASSVSSRAASVRPSELLRLKVRAIDPP